MSRFFDLENVMINVDHIVRVHLCPNHAAEIYMDDGVILRGQNVDLDELRGYLDAKAVLQVEGVESVFTDHGEYIRKPVSLLVLTESGELLPLEVFNAGYRRVEDGFFETLCDCQKE